MKFVGFLLKIKSILHDVTSMQRWCGFAYVAMCKQFPLRPNTVFFEAAKGEEFIRSPYYMARHILSTDAYQHLQVVIVCRWKEKTRLHKDFTGRSFKTCTPNSLRYCFYLATSRFLVNDVTFPLYFSRRDGQQYLNTWHGTPLKTLGRQCPSDLFAFVSNTQRNFLHATDILAPNLHTEQVLLYDYMIGKFWNGRVLHGGYPQNDVFFYPQEANALQSRLNVAFMPTWRGTLATVKQASREHIKELKELFEYLEMALPEQVTFWVKIHPLAKKRIELKGFQKLKLFPENIDFYQHLAKCNVLVTDYSSVLFDFALTRKPILLYIPDILSYFEERNLSIDLNQLPFEKLMTPDALVKRLSDFLSELPLCSSDYEKFIANYCPYDQGKNTDAVCTQFFLSENRLKIHKITPNSAQKNILLFGGAFLNNGVTTSLKNLLLLLDKEKFNIIIYVPRNNRKEVIDYFYNLDKRIDFIPATNFLAVDFLDITRFVVKDFFVQSWKSTDVFMRTLWLREWRRQFGVAHFDVCVDFDGYSRRTTFLMLGCIECKKVMFVHNDMALEVEKNRIKDVRALRLGYEIADAVATVRQGAETGYCQKYFDFQSKLFYVPNTLSTQCVELSQRPLSVVFSEGKDAPIYSRVTIALNAANRFRFINLARFSPEKGQIRLIEAFEQVWQKEPSAELYIVGAHGVLYQKVCQRAFVSQAAAAIHVVMGSSNPFPLFVRMDALILSSFYEGKPVVLYEAFAFGLPIISTDISGPAELLRDGYGLVVDNNVDGLIAGMRAAIKEEVPRSSYNFEAHNDYALKQFYNVINA